MVSTTVSIEQQKRLAPVVGYYAVLLTIGLLQQWPERWSHWTLGKSLFMAPVILVAFVVFPWFLFCKAWRDSSG